MITHHDVGKLGSKFTYLHTPIGSSKGFVFFILLLVISFTIGAYTVLNRLENTVVTLILYLLVTFIVFFILKKRVAAETLLILPSLGIQVETLYLFGQVETQFIHFSNIKDIIINEAITMSSVVCYLMVILCDSKTGQVTKMDPLFKHSWPPLTSIKSIYQAAQEKLILPNRR